MIKKSNTKIAIIISLFIFLFVILLVILYSSFIKYTKISQKKSELNYINQVFDINLPYDLDKKQWFDERNNSFHGDGDSLDSYSLSQLDKQQKDTIYKSFKKWNSLPIDQKIWTYMPSINKNSPIHNVTQGYWKIIWTDENQPYKTFRLGIYDEKNSIFYYYRVD